MRTYALIPAYNEAQTIYQVVTEVKKYVDEVIVVDDGSSDQTSFEALRGGVLVLRHIINRGQGAALQTGLDYTKLQATGLPRHGGASKLQAFVVVTFDADGQFDASEIPSVVAPIKTGEADVVLGSRFLGGITRMPRVKKLFLRAAVFLTNLTTGLQVTDTHNGLRALSGRAVGVITITQDRMAHGSEILSEIAKHKLSYREIPVTVKYSDYSLSKGQKMGDYFKILFDLFLRKLIQ